MKDIFIYGSGGMGKETVQLIEDINCFTSTWSVVGFIDDFAEAGTIIDGIRVLGDCELLRTAGRTAYVVIAVGDPAGRRLVFNKLKGCDVHFPTLVHPSAKICRNVTIGRGAVIGMDCILSVNVNVGNYVFINTRTVLGHDVSIGDFSTCLVNCLVSGNVAIGEGTLLGSNSVIMEKKRIGNGVRISMGAIVDSDVEDNHVVMNRPSKSMLF